VLPVLAVWRPAPGAGGDAPDKPRLRTPAERETTRAVPPTPPLLIPGRPFAPDSVHETRGQRAKEHVQRARKLESHGFPDAALVEYQNAAGLDATLPGVFDHIGKIYDAFGIYPRGIHACSLEVQHHPESGDAARRLGVALVRGGETAKGVQQLELLIRGHAQDGDTWRALGFAYTYAHQYHEAERALRAAIALPPEEA